MKASYFLLLTLSLITFTETKHPPLSSQIDLLVRQQIEELQIPRIGVAVAENGKVLHVGTYRIANIEWDQQVTKNTAFQIASVTKLFTSTLVTKFMQEGNYPFGRSRY
jgi:serine-type D-Ala-D-Ala carboxypeptidase